MMRDRSALFTKSLLDLILSFYMTNGQKQHYFFYTTESFIEPLRDA